MDSGRTLTNGLVGTAPKVPPYCVLQVVLLRRVVLQGEGCTAGKVYCRWC